MSWTLFVEYLKTVISWPVAAVVIIALFKNQIRELLNRVVKVKFPGGELEAQQKPEPPAGNANVNPPPPALPQGLQISEEDRRAIVQVIQSQAAAGRLWEYRYLNYFLARPSHFVLNWLVALNRRTTANEYEAFWTPLIPDPAQRFTILQVLNGHHLIQEDGPSILATEKGKEYVNWRGPLPPLGPPPPPATRPAT